MTNRENSGDNTTSEKRSSHNGDSIATLMRLAGPRATVPLHVEQRVHAAVRQEWRGTVRRRRVFRWSIPFALAATIFLAVTLSSRGPDVNVAPVATVVLLEGAAGLQRSGLSIAEEVYPGDVIETGDYGMSLAGKNGLSLRLGAETTATFGSSRELTLIAGRIYVDTGLSAEDDRSITVQTGLGSATDIGTRFAVAYLDGDMSVAVRDGRVDVSDNRQSYRAESGEKLTLMPNEAVIRDSIPAHDSSWDWAMALAPAFEINDRSLLEFLEWASRETGKELVFESEAARIAAMETRLRGSVADFTPVEAVDSVLPTTRFEYRIDARQIVIGGYSQ